MSVWDVWNASKGPRYPHAKVVQFVLRNYPHVTVGARALDLGCGSGVHVAFLLDCGFDVIAIDGSAVGLVNTADLVAGRLKSVELQEAQLSTFEVPEASIDCLISVGVLDAAGAGEAAAASPRIVKALKPGGKAMLVFAAAGDFRLAQEPQLGLHGYTYEEVHELFSAGDEATCWIDQYITTYEGDRIRQIDWLVTLTKK